MSYKSSVEAFASSIQSDGPAYNSPFLLPLADYSNPVNLRKLAQKTGQYIPDELRRLRLNPGALLDEKEVNYVMATDGWIPTEEPVETLRKVMPSGVVSDRADRVAIWKRLERAFERQPGRVAAYDSRAFFIIEGTASYLVTIDFKNSMIASSCPEFNSEKDSTRRRFELCKHSVAALIYYREPVFARSGLPKSEIQAWETSFQKCQSLSHAIRANYYYYFLKRFVPALQLKVAYYANMPSVKAAISFLISSQPQS